MSYQLEKRFRFEAAHRLPHHDDKCARLHGHSWVGWLIVKGDHLHTSGPKAGMLVDYGDLGKLINPICEEFLDHHFLNETLGLESPTSEAIAKWIFDRLKNQIPFEFAVAIEETCTSRCVYFEQRPDLLRPVNLNLPVLHEEDATEIQARIDRAMGEHLIHYPMKPHDVGYIDEDCGNLRGIKKT